MKGIFFIKNPTVIGVHTICELHRILHLQKSRNVLLGKRCLSVFRRRYFLHLHANILSKICPHD